MHSLTQQIPSEEGSLLVHPVWCMKTQSQVSKETQEGETPIS